MGSMTSTQRSIFYKQLNYKYPDFIDLPSILVLFRMTCSWSKLFYLEEFASHWSIAIEYHLVVYGFNGVFKADWICIQVTIAAIHILTPNIYTGVLETNTIVIISVYYLNPHNIIRDGKINLPRELLL